MYAVTVLPAETPDPDLKSDLLPGGVEPNPKWPTLPPKHRAAVGHAEGPAQHSARLIESHHLHRDIRNPADPAGRYDSLHHYLALFSLLVPVEIEEGVLADRVMEKVLGRRRVGRCVVDPAAPRQDAGESDEQEPNTTQAGPARWPLSSGRRSGRRI